MIFDIIPQDIMLLYVKTLQYNCKESENKFVRKLMQSHGMMCMFVQLFIFNADDLY